MSATIKAQHTIVDTKALLRIIQKRYPSIGASECRLMAIGCNDNFRIKGKRQNYAFRLVRYGWWPEKDVDEELRLLETLQRRKLNVCKPVRTDKNQRYFNVKTAEGIRHGMLFTFLPGRPLGHNFGKRNSNMHLLGKMLAQIHETADQMKEPVQRWSMDSDAVFPSFFEAAPSVLGHREKDITYLHKLAEQFKDVIAGQPEGTLDFGLCHGDLHVHNVMLQENGGLGIFDFDWCGYSWRSYDLATVWWSLPRNEKGIAPWRALLRGYTQVRKLSRQEEKILPWFVVFRQFEYFNFQLSVRKHFGDSWMNDNYYDFHISFLKDWKKRHRDVMC